MKKLLTVLLIGTTCVCLILSGCKKAEEVAPAAPEAVAPAPEAVPAPEAAPAEAAPAEAAPAPEAAPAQ